MALAPAGFGSFGGDLLVGNFGDGVINVYNPTTFAFLGSLQSVSATSNTNIANPGLWEIFFGQGGTLGNSNTLYFAAGINGGRGGLFGSIGVAQPGAGAPNFTFTAASTSLTLTGATPGNVSLSLAATNGFNGPVTFSCTSTTVSCTFSPSAVTLSGTGTTTVAVAVAESTPITTPVTPGNPYFAGRSAHLFGSPAGLTLAVIGPAGLLAFAGLRRRSNVVRRSLLVRGSLLALMLLAGMAGVTGCSSSQPSAASMAATPVPSQVTINATSGAITQSVTIALTEQ